MPCSGGSDQSTALVLAFGLRGHPSHFQSGRLGLYPVPPGRIIPMRLDIHLLAFRAPERRRGQYDDGDTMVSN